MLRSLPLGLGLASGVGVHLRDTRHALLVQLFLLYYGLAQFEGARSACGPGCARRGSVRVAAFAINTCAYTTEILHGAMRAVPAGEMEAARALGMSRWMVLRRIVLPSACGAACRPTATRSCSCCTAPRWPAWSRCTI
jgi:ABC-type arginine/histidine transport system permease subunit